MTLRTQLLNRLKHEDCWTNGGTLERWEFRSRKGLLYKPSTVGRTLRDLHEEMPERVERELQGRSVAYRYKKSVYEINHEKLRV